MKIHYLHENQESSTAIVVFAGFAGHFSHFSHLDSKHNVILCYDYSDFAFCFDSSKYKEIWLLAYSFGVYIATQVFYKHNCTLAIAINGTNYAIHKNYGIHPSIYKHTMKNFCSDDFKKSLFMDSLILAKDFCFANEANLKQELCLLYDFYHNADTLKQQTFAWDKALISTQDSIFPPQSCKNFFMSCNTKMHAIHAPHFPFFAFKSWEEICQI